MGAQVRLATLRPIDKGDGALSGTGAAPVSHVYDDTRRQPDDGWENDLAKLVRVTGTHRAFACQTMMPISPPSLAALVISRVMRPGREESYDPWTKRVIAAGQADRHLISAVRLDQTGGIHHLILQFTDRTAMTHWSEQQAYRALVEQADAFSVGLQQDADGTVMGFDLPSEAAAKKWKTALVTWLGVVPTLLIVSNSVAWALPNIPRVLQQILSSILLTSALTWLILPKVRGWSRFWMMQNKCGELQNRPD